MYIRTNSGKQAVYVGVAGRIHSSRAHALTSMIVFYIYAGLAVKSLSAKVGEYKANMLTMVNS
jgi:hypothetical protein